MDSILSEQKNGCPRPQLETPSHTTHTTLDTYIIIGLIVDVIIFFFGLVGNLLVIHVQRKSKRQTRARYFLQLNALGSIM